MTKIRSILNSLIASALIILCVFGSYANADSGSEIIGLLQKHRLQEKALDNILSEQLKNTDRIYNKQLLELDIQYSIDKEALSKLNNEEKLKLVNESGRNESYEAERKALKKTHQENNAKLLKAHKLKKNEINYLRKLEKKELGHAHASKTNELKNTHKVEYNKLKEKHNANTKELYLLHKSESNRLDEVMSSEINSLKETWKPEIDQLEFKHKQDLAKNLSISAKDYFNRIYKIELGNLREQHREAGLVLARKQELRKQDLKVGQNIQNEALKTLHHIESEGGIYSEYIHNKELLADFNLLLSYELDSNKITTSVSNNSETLFDAYTKDNNSNNKSLMHVIDRYRTPDGSLVFFSPQNDDKTRWMSGQCVTGAVKLFNEISDLKINQSIGPADQIPDNSFISSNYHIESDPTKPVVGPMIVWKNASKQIGHVGVITDVNSDTITVYDANSGKTTDEFDQWGLESYTQAQQEFVNKNYGKYTRKTFEYKEADQLNILGTNFVFYKYIYPK